MRFNGSSFVNSSTEEIIETLMSNGYKGEPISANEIIVYVMLRRRLRLSMANKKGFCDEDGFFIYFSIEELCKKTNAPKRTVQRWLSELKRHGLISTKVQGLGKPQKIYVNLIEASDEPFKNADDTDDIAEAPIMASRDAENGVQGCKKWRAEAQEMASPYREEYIQRLHTREYIPPTPQEGVVVEGKSVDEKSSSQNNPSPAKQIRTMFESFAGNNQELLEALDGWKEFRGKMTPRAVKLNLSKLYKLSGGDEQKAIEIVNQSVENGWKGFFEIRERSSNRKRQSRQATETEKALKMFEEMEKMENEQDETSPSNHDFFV